MKGFNAFIHNHTLHYGKKHFCHSCLQGFSREGLKHHIKNCFKVNGKQRIIIPIKGEYIKFKNYENTLNSKIYADFKSILVPEDNGKKNPEESYTNKYKKHIGCSYGYKLILD